MAKPGAVIAAADANNTSAISVSIFLNRTHQKIQAPYIESIQDSLEEQGRKAGGLLTVFTNVGPLTIGGAPAFEIGCITFFPKDEKVYIHQYAVFSNLEIYVISVQTFDVREEAKLVAAAKSFRFSDPPDLPDVPDDPHARIGVMMGEDISLVMPSNWYIKKTAKGWFEAREVAGAGSVNIQVLPTSEGQVDPQAYLEKVKKNGLPPQMKEKGVTIYYGQEGLTSIGSVPAYFLQSVLTFGGTKKVYWCYYVFLAHHKAYIMAAGTDDLDKVPLVEKIARSMRIGAGMTAEQVAALASVPDKSASYTLGFRMGQITFYVLLAAAVLWGVYLVWRRIRR